MKPTVDIIEETPQSPDKPAEPIEYVRMGLPSGGKKALGNQALNGAVWTFGGFGCQQVVRFAAQLVLARLLTPNAFGLVALVFVIRDGLQMFSDVGLGPALIQSKRSDLDFIRTAWTLQVARGFSIFALVSLLGPVLAAVYGDPRLVWVAPLAAITALIDGFASTSIYTSARRMKVRDISILELVSQVIGSGTIVSYAYFVDRSVVALLIGGMTMSLVRTVGSHWLNRATPDGLKLDRLALREILVFGRWVMVSSILMYLASNTDRLLAPVMLYKPALGVAGAIGGILQSASSTVGHSRSLAAFGVYSIALGIAAIPLQTIMRVGGRVVFPTFSRTLNSGGDLRRAFSKARRFVVTGGGVSAAFFFAAGPAIITFLYPKGYHDAGVYLTITAVSLWFLTLDAANQAAIVARGDTRTSALANVVKLVVMLIGFTIGLQLHGLKGALVGIAFSDAAKYLYSSYMNVRMGLPLVRIDVVSTLWFASAGIALRFLLGANPTANRLADLRDIFIAGVVSSIAAAALFWWLRERGNPRTPPASNGLTARAAA